MGELLFAFVRGVERRNGSRTGDLNPEATDLLSARLESVTDAAAFAWPQLPRLQTTMAKCELAEALGARIDADALNDLGAAELALSLHCARGERIAMELLELHYFAPVRIGLGSMKLHPSMLDDVMQETRQRMLVADAGQPKLVQCAGTGKLRGLVQVAAARIALDMLRKGKHTDLATGELTSESFADQALQEPALDPALALLRNQAGTRFRRAFREACAALTPRERNLLNLHHLHGVGLEKLATMYQVHRATIVRQLAEVRRKLVHGTQRALASDSSNPSAELSSMLGLLGSQLDASVKGLLSDDNGES
jgi:RNA polymerase sigma-70 factor, ECF subfamily